MLVSRISNLAGRNLMKNFVRNSGGHGMPKPGDNLPFGIVNRYALTAWFTVFCGTAMAIPFAIVRFQLKKQ